MSKKVVVYQPCYFPKLHYLARIKEADKLILFDDVEFSRRSRQHRAEINFNSKKWLTIPIKHKGKHIGLNEAAIDNSKSWQNKHRGTLKHKYGSDASIFDDIFEKSQDKENFKLVDITIPTLLTLLEEFGIETEVVKSSEIDFKYEDPSKYLAELVDYVGGDKYICGEEVYDDYLKDEEFEEREIDIEIQDWDSEWEDGNVCCLDVLFNASEPEKFVK